MSEVKPASAEPKEPAPNGGYQSGSGALALLVALLTGLLSE